MKLLQVRCCCEPGRVLGHLQIPDAEAHLGARIRYTFRDLQPWPWKEPEMQTRIVTLVLEVRALVLELDKPDILAIEAHEDALPLLRRLPGFTEAVE